jgi:phage terminase small subunit
VATRKDQPGLENDWRLTPKQALFVVEYLKDLNQVQAAIRAGYSADTAQKNAYRLMAIEGVKQAIAAGTAKAGTWEYRLVLSASEMALTAKPGPIR